METSIRPTEFGIAFFLYSFERSDLCSPRQSSVEGRIVGGIGEVYLERENTRPTGVREIGLPTSAR